MSKRRNRPSSGKHAMSANLRKIARQNQLYGFRMALDGIAATWGALIQNLRCDADLTDEQVQKIIRIGDRYWEMVGKFKEEDMNPDERGITNGQRTLLPDEDDQQSAWSVRLRERKVRMVERTWQLLFSLVDCTGTRQHRNEDEEVRA